MRALASLLMIPAAVAAGVALARWQGAPAPAAPSQPVARFDVPEVPRVDAEFARRPPVAFRTTVLGSPAAPRPPAAAPAPAAPKPAAPAPLPVLRAVLIDGDRRLAQIGERIAGEGATVSGHRVDRIEQRRVRLVSLESGRSQWIVLDNGF